MAGPLKNIKHEAFVQGLLQGLSPVKAYVLAGYAGNDGNASHLKSNPKIQARLAELQGKVAQIAIVELGLSRAVVLKELAKIALAPLDDNNVRVADKRQALVDIGKMEGWIVDRKEIGDPGDFDRLSDEELIKEIQRESEAVVGDKRLN